MKFTLYSNINKKQLLLFVFLIFISISTFGQHLIGENKQDIKLLMKEKYPLFYLDESTINKKHNYLKYVDRYEQQTLLIFLSEKDTCTYTQLISDYYYLKDISRDLNKKYEVN